MIRGLPWVDLAGRLSIEKVESFSQLFDFVLCESWSLDFLLGRPLSDGLSLHLFQIYQLFIMVIKGEAE